MTREAVAMLDLLRRNLPVWRDELRVCDRKAAEELITAGLAEWNHTRDGALLQLPSKPPA